MKKLEGKVAIITGGSGVIGYTTAKELAENGAKVMLVDINEKSLKGRLKEAEELGYDMSYIVADVTKAEDVKNYVDKTIEKYGKLQLFFNNAGTEGEFNKRENYSEEVFNKVMPVNMEVVFLRLKYE